MNIWLCPVKPRNWHIIKKVKMFGVPRHEHKVFSQVKPGDLLVFHVSRPISGIVAVGKVISQIFEGHKDIWGKARYPLRVRIEIDREDLNNDNEAIPLSALIGVENSEIEIEPHLLNVWITKISKKQYQNLVRQSQNQSISDDGSSL